MSTWRKSALYRRLEAIPDMTERVKTYITYVVNYYTEDPKRRGQVNGHCMLRTGSGKKCAIGLLWADTRLKNISYEEFNDIGVEVFDEVLPEGVQLAAREWHDFGRATRDLGLPFIRWNTYAGGKIDPVFPETLTW